MRSQRLRLAALEAALAGQQTKTAAVSALAMGRATLVLGSVTVAHAAVTASSNIVAFHQVPSGVTGAIGCTARTPGVSFTISGLVSDLSTIAWFRFEP